MARSPYTLEAAREILLGKRSPAVKVLDALLGVGILAAGPVGLATGQPWLLAVWGWVDQKNELVVRLDELVGKGRGKLRRATGRQRHEILAATHTALVTGSFLAALREVVGPVVDRAGVHGTAYDGGVLNDTVDRLLHTDIPLPWAGAGFESNLQRGVRRWYRAMGTQVLAVFPANGLSKLEPLVERAVERYRAEYLALAAEVPEFRIWAVFGEHRAEQQALGRLEELVGGLVTAARSPEAATRATVAGINRAILSRDIVDADDAGRVTQVRVPTVEDGYVEPRFRWAVMRDGSRPAEDAWWSEQGEGTDLAGFLAAHFASPEAAGRPLVVLGHPGAGKSLFTKVCAARLSATDAFVAVRVPLRDLTDPSVSVYRQIEEVLRDSTHGKVEWPALCAASRHLVRVVLVDGLDELMQATGTTESRYLRNVMDFQRTELDTTGPVAVVVTSRTVVADLAAIPPGCLVVRLEEFTDAQVDTWVERWSTANAAAVGSGAVRAVEAATMRRYGDLARQPLLLLLLAIVAAERDLPPPQSSADLYRILLDDFVGRELARPDREADDLDAGTRRASELWKLGLVAFGMLNRGQQHLREPDLAADLAALPALVPAQAGRGRDMARTLDPARRVVGRFFFVHTAEAEAGAGGRSYEFLHATFGDYLIAHHTATLLRDAAAARRQATAFRSWDDDLLFALLSHTLLVAYGSRAVSFFAELVGADEAVADLLEHLVVAAHDRWDRGRHGDYDPSGRGPAWRLAAYTANLVSLRVAMAAEPVPVARLCPQGVAVDEWWPTQVRLWTAVLPVTQWSNLVDSVRLVPGPEPCLSWGQALGYHDENAAELALDTPRAARLAVGRALLDYRVNPGVTSAVAAAGVLANAVQTWELDQDALDVLESVDDLPLWLGRLVATAAARHAADLDTEVARGVLAFCRRAGVLSSGQDLAALVVRHPDLLDEPWTPPFPSLASWTLALAALTDDPDARTTPARPASLDLLETPEGWAVRELPPDLARRLLPELAKSLAERWRRQRRQRLVTL